MATESSSASGGGVGVLGLLGVAFIVLKLTGYLTWSWLWVLAPFWIPISLGLLVFAGVYGWILFQEWRDEQRAEKWRRERQRQARAADRPRRGL